MIGRRLSRLQWGWSSCSTSDSSTWQKSAKALPHFKTLLCGRLEALCPVVYSNLLAWLNDPLDYIQPSYLLQLIRLFQYFHAGMVTGFLSPLLLVSLECCGFSLALSSVPSSLQLSQAPWQPRPSNNENLCLEWRLVLRILSPSDSKTLKYEMLLLLTYF